MRYSIEYCGKKYLLIERTKSIIIFEATTSQEVRQYAKNNNIQLINEK